MHRSAHQAPISLYDQGDRGLPLCYLLKDWAPGDMHLDWESEKLVKRGRKARNFSRKDAYAPEWTGGREKGKGHGRRHGEERERYCLHEPGYERGAPRLRRSGRLDRHDIWYEGRRY